MSEPGAGTDVLGMATTAVPSSDGSRFSINGSKMWITNGTLTGTDTGDIHIIYAKTSPARGDLTSFLGAFSVITLQLLHYLHLTYCPYSLYFSDLN